MKTRDFLKIDLDSLTFDNIGRVVPCKNCGSKDGIDLYKGKREIRCPDCNKSYSVDTHVIPIQDSKTALYKEILKLWIKVNS